MLLFILELLSLTHQLHSKTDFQMVEQFWSSDAGDKKLKLEKRSHHSRTNSSISSTHPGSFLPKTGKVETSPPDGREELRRADLVVFQKLQRESRPRNRDWVVRAPASHVLDALTNIDRDFQATHFLSSSVDQVLSEIYTRFVVKIFSCG